MKRAIEGLLIFIFQTIRPGSTQAEYGISPDQILTTPISDTVSIFYRCSYKSMI